ncbi:MAG: PVC-type heme-binding CxxCH protein [Opitutus sp.]
MKRHSRVSFAMVLLAITTVAQAYKEVPPPAKVVLPPSKSPAESLASIVVPPEFEVELVAAEPLVRDPIDLAWGADGRLWVVEMADYPLGLDGKGQPGGRIRVLESTQRDGHYDKSTLFAEGLRFPTSVMPWRKGVLVVAVPDVLLLEDTNGDGRADRTTRLFTGVGEGNQQHLANGLQWGLDGWLHLANGNSGGKISSASGGPVIEVGQRDFRLQPDQGLIDLLAGQSQFGRNRDDWGNWFGCNNSNPIWYYALNDRYLRRNPHVVPPKAVIDVAAEPGAAHVFPRSRTLARFNDPEGEDHFTSACGVMIYRDDWLGTELAGNVFVAEPVHNLVHREIIRPVGVTFRSERAASEQTSEFFASSDNWSRFTAVRSGPDGALYVVDMYRLPIEHPQWIPAAWQKELGDLRAGENQGRIYRIRPKGKPLRTVPLLDATAEASALVAALESPSGAVRDLAQQQLAWRADQTVVPALEHLAVNASLPASRMQALWTLRLLGSLREAVVTVALRDLHPGVRRHAVELSEVFANASPTLLREVSALVADRDAFVRLQVAYTLGAWQDSAAGIALARLLRADPDPLVRAAALSSGLPHAETILTQLAATGRPDDPLLLEVAAVTESAKAVSALLGAISTPGTGKHAREQFLALAQLLDWMQRQRKSWGELQATADPAMKAGLLAAADLFVKARQSVQSQNAALEERLAAMPVLGRGRDQQDEDMERLASLLTPVSPVPLQLAAVTALGRLNRRPIPQHLLSHWSNYTAPLREAVVSVLASRPVWTQALLDRAADDPELRAQISTVQRAALTQHGTAAIADRAQQIFGAAAVGDRQKVIDHYLAAIAGMAGDPGRGQRVWVGSCSACHRFAAVAGGGVGPDLAAVSDRSAGYLLTHILDPNRAVEDRYSYYTATTLDGREIAGMLGAEANNAVTLRGLDGVEHVVFRRDLKSLVRSSRSLMPEGFEASVSPESMADLIAFLAGSAAADPSRAASNSLPNE